MSSCLHLRKCQRGEKKGYLGKGAGRGRVLPFANTTSRPNYKGLKHILLICGEFGICILEPAFGVVELRLNEVIGLAICWFLWDSDVSLERKRGKGLIFFFSFQWRLLLSNGRKGNNWKRGFSPLLGSTSHRLPRPVYPPPEGVWQGLVLGGGGVLPKWPHGDKVDQQSLPW